MPEPGTPAPTPAAVGGAWEVSAGSPTGASDPAVAAALASAAGPVLGIDAGGTSTRAALLDAGTVTQRYTSGPLNFLLHDDGVPRMAALAQAARPAALGIGVPGLARAPGAAAAFAASVTAACGVPARVASDAAIAWLGAFLGGPGIVVMAGMGSVAVGGTSLDSLTLIGGHGHLAGDEGSRYWIGREALRAALAAMDGTGPPTQLERALAEASASSLDEIVLRVQQAPGDRGILAAFAPLAGRCAAEPQADPVARAILAEAAAGLTALVAALRRRLGDLPVAASGGVFGLEPLWTDFHEVTGAQLPLAPPEVGAALLAVHPAAVSPAVALPAPVRLEDGRPDSVRPDTGHADEGVAG